MNKMIPYPTWGFRGTIAANSAKLYFTDFLHKKQVYMNACTYGTLISLHTYLDIQHLDSAWEVDSASSAVTYTKTSLFLVKNKNQFTTNSNVYNINTRQRYNFHQPSSNLSLYQTIFHKV